MAQDRKGRASIFRGKDLAHKLQGHLTPVGTSRFEAARRRLGKLAGRDVDDVSVGDTFEYLARGDAATRKYLAEQER